MTSRGLASRGWPAAGRRSVLRVPLPAATQRGRPPLQKPTRLPRLPSGPQRSVCCLQAEGRAPVCLPKVAFRPTFCPPGRAVAKECREDAARPLGARAARVARRRVLHEATRGVVFLAPCGLSLVASPMSTCNCMAACSCTVPMRRVHTGTAAICVSLQGTRIKLRLNL